MKTTWEMRMMTYNILPQIIYSAKPNAKSYFHYQMHNTILFPKNVTTTPLHWAIVITAPKFKSLGLIWHQIVQHGIEIRIGQIRCPMNCTKRSTVARIWVLNSKPNLNTISVIKKIKEMDAI